MSVPFSLPFIDDDVVDEVVDALTGTGWITSGPKVQEFEAAIAAYTGCESTVAVSSWTAGAMVALRWFGVRPGDEVIVPAYTYCATALVAMNLGATPIMVDVKAPFHIDAEKLADAITHRTKAIIPVDTGGWPCDYQAIFDLLESDTVKDKFQPANSRQEQLARPLLLADAAHSFGARVADGRIGSLGDVSIFSFHSVKNLTTGEGGMICLNLPEPFDSSEEAAIFRYLALNGQNKSALEKSTVGGWRYDILEQGFKANMPDICAAIGLAQLRKYEDRLLPERKRLFASYNDILATHDWALLPPTVNKENESSYHLYQLRIRDLSEAGRNDLIQTLSDKGFGVNVHYVPLPMLTLFRDNGYEIANFPFSYSLYENEITLPIYNNLSKTHTEAIATSIVDYMAKRGLKFVRNETAS